MAYNLNRIYSGLTLILCLLLSYLLHLDLILFLILIILITYDIYVNNLLNLKSFLGAIFLFLLLIYLDKYLTLGLYPISIIILIFFFLSNYFYQYLLFFNLVILFFVFSSYELIQNERHIFYIIISLSFINDTCAYIVGNIIKGPLIFPKISPKKTWSGTSISIFLSFCLLFYYLNFTIFISIFVSLMFFLGDMYFSFIKRINKLKDFSNIIPGHGGILDRIDSFLFPIILINLSL